MAAYRALEYEAVDGVARVTLNRPNRLNALNREILDELAAVGHEIASDPHVRAVVLRANGRAFCSGADLTSIEEYSDGRSVGGLAIRQALERHFDPAILAWAKLQVPVISAVNGPAVGAGMSLALVADLIVASEQASFIPLFAPKLGLAPDMGSSFLLPRLVGLARAKSMVLLGEPLLARDALNWGLVYAVCAPEELDSCAMGLAIRLRSGPTIAFSCIKTLFADSTMSTLAQQLDAERAVQGRLAETHDFQEGLNAFKEKRKPNFRGR